MTDQTNSGSQSNAVLAFVLGGVVVALGVLGWVVLGGSLPGDEPDISITVPGVGSVEGEVTESQ
ncbi:hypothetical protein [Shimia sp. SDUM112013]|uniref:hypothetical protein n=1 Tax=Shimia sp. SDUM112013 TaxID=3136160 RepID=UPI0032EE98D5